MHHGKPASPTGDTPSWALFSSFSNAESPHTAYPAAPDTGRDCCDHHQLQEQLSLGHQRLAALERGNLHLQEQLDQTHERLERTEKRLSAALAAQARQRGDLPTDAHAAHQVLARDYQTFVEHRVYALARAAVDHTQRPVGHQPAPLWMLGELTRALFEETPTADRLAETLHLGNSGRYVLATRTDSVLAQASKLWQRADNTGLVFRWDFELLPGARIDTARQTAWLSCDPDLPVQHLVAPGYIVESKVYGRQQVLTGPSLPG
ncbi:hypothetical protein ABZ820_41920 [Streptomyces diacarni]|uniref:hypothetical protein n=1 Tax=Streptomyces diacarni TaxID=2800381 RepID=UPI0033F63EED